MVNFHKTRIMRRGVRQHLGGVVVNEYPNIRRNDYGTLKAILHNATRSGLESQNREGHPPVARPPPGADLARPLDQSRSWCEAARVVRPCVGLRKVAGINLC